jgi:hypothetical protein
MNHYPSIYNMGHAAIADLLKTPVMVQEKVDGSQFGFMVDELGQVHARSKGCKLNIDIPEKMFVQAIETVKELGPILHPGWTYRGEYLAKPKHNALVYSRVPTKHIILFDINPGLEQYLPYEEVAAEAARIGLEVVPKLYEGRITNLQEFRSFLDTESVLGGQKIEGVVVKPVGYGLFGRDKKVLMGKFVSEAFKEVHGAAWKEANPGQLEILRRLEMDYQTQARWQKAVLHLKERGELEGSPSDIGKLMKEVGQDIDKECQDEIKHTLYSWAWPKLQRAVVRGLPEWYKNELLKLQFEVKESA